MADTPGKSIGDEQDERAFGEWAARTGLPRDVADAPAGPLAAAQQEAANRITEAWRRAIHMDTTDDLLARARRAMTDDLEYDAAFIELKDAVSDLDTLLSAGGPLPSAWAGKVDEVVRYLTAADAEIVKLRALHGEAANLLSEAGTEIARLTAELDDCRNVPVEYVTERGLEAAMAADPHREDGTLLRTTDGQKRAWAWKAAAKEWEQVT